VVEKKFEGDSNKAGDINMITLILALGASLCMCCLMGVITMYFYKKCRRDMKKKDL